MTEIVDKIIEYDNFDYEANIFCIGDMHIGNEGFDAKLFEKILRDIKTYPNYYILGMGDMGEFISPRDKRFEMDTHRKLMKPKEQFNIIYGYFKPFKGVIIGLHIGNHEHSMDKYNYHSITKDLCRKLKTTYLGYDAFTTLHFRRMGSNGKRSHSATFDIYSTHGTGGGLLKGSKINRIEQFAQWIDAEIFLCGHVHELLADNDVQLAKRGKSLVQRKRVFGLTGSFLRGYAKGSISYVERTQKKPVLMGCLRLRINPEERKIEASIFTGD